MKKPSETNLINPSLVSRPDETRELEMSDTPIEEIIASREPIKTERLKTAFNEVFLVDLKDAGRVIFKPYDGEDHELKKYVQYKRERAAYLFDKIFNWGLVPPTVIRDIDGRVGSAQVFVEDASTPTDDAPSEELGDTFKKDKLKLYAFDFLIGNDDRHGNYLIKEGRIVAIDNGLTFQAPTENEYSLYKEAILENKNFLKNLLADKKGIGMFLRLLAELIPQTEIDGFKKRLVTVAETLNVDFSI